MFNINILSPSLFQNIRTFIINWFLKLCKRPIFTYNLLVNKLSLKQIIVQQAKKKSLVNKSGEIFLVEVI